VIVDSIAGDDCLANGTGDGRLHACRGNAGNVAAGNFVGCLSRIVNVLLEFLRGHKVQSQYQKEKN
jgi:hypothetical protein